MGVSGGKIDRFTKCILRDLGADRPGRDCCLIRPACDRVAADWPDRTARDRVLSRAERFGVTC